MHYRIAPPQDARAAAILETTWTALQADPAMQSDLASLSKACCQPERFVSLLGAPMPATTH